MRCVYKNAFIFLHSTLCFILSMTGLLLWLWFHCMLAQIDTKNHVGQGSNGKKVWQLCLTVYFICKTVFWHNRGAHCRCQKWNTKKEIKPWKAFLRLCTVIKLDFYFAYMQWLGFSVKCWLCTTLYPGVASLEVVHQVNLASGKWKMKRNRDFWVVSE